jgi:chromosomal replication initiator protein
MPINPKFTFDSFVVGSSNEFIFAAAKAVAENPGDAYNPLFIHGGTGLGKTHILMAIANYLKVHRPTLNVLYATCEQFTNQLVESISKGKALKTEEFRRRYRNVDVLLIDDVQFLAQKQATQSEFFHTFNELVMQNKQIVLTCDRPPEHIEVLEDRLKTRFEGGSKNTNSEVGEKELREYCELDKECEGVMREAFESMRLSARARARILKVARTIADLELSEKITPEHLYEAISYRTYGATANE